jgi:hypothetical protein
MSGNVVQQHSYHLLVDSNGRPVQITHGQMPTTRSCSHPMQEPGGTLLHSGLRCGEGKPDGRCCLPEFSHRQ